MRSKKEPTEREIEIIRIMNDREWAVANVDSTDFFLSGFNAVRWLLLRDPFNIPFGLGLLCIISQLLSVTGLSFSLANKILDLVGPEPEVRFRPLRVQGRREFPQPPVGKAGVPI